jgi:hypothetical protein
MQFTLSKDGRVDGSEGSDRDAGSRRSKYLLFAACFDPSLPPDLPPAVQDDTNFGSCGFFTLEDRHERRHLAGWLDGILPSYSGAAGCRPTSRPEGGANPDSTPANPNPSSH